jgi:hypothetical protein
MHRKQLTIPCIFVKNVEVPELLTCMYYYIGSLDVFPVTGAWIDD